MPELPLPGDEFAGYRLRAVISRSERSTVYRGEHPRLGPAVALKVRVPESACDDAFRARFREESAIAASLRHPHIIPVYETGSSDGLLYLAMRYVPGTDLGKMIRTSGPLPPRAAVLLLSQAAGALEAAHRHGLVHGDVTPAHLLIEPARDDDGPGHLYLTGFGRPPAGGGGTGPALAGAALGAPGYLAPEQLRGLPADGRADQYALGCVLYESLTGRRPFDADLHEDRHEDRHEDLWAVPFGADPARPTRLRPELPRPVDDVLARVLAEQPDDRYESCREFLAAARDALGLTAARGALGLAAATPAAGRSGRTLRPPPPMEELTRAGALPPRGPAVSGPAVSGPAVSDPAVSDPAVSGPAAGPGAGSSGGLDRGWFPSRPRVPGVPEAGGPLPVGPGQPRRGGGRRISLLLLVIACAVALGLGVTIGAWTGFGRAAGARAAAGPAAARPAADSALAPPALSPAPTRSLEQALALLNVTDWTTGYLPPRSCTFASAVNATCIRPYPAIMEATFQDYRSPAALYRAYAVAIRRVDNGAFFVNRQDCGSSAPPSSGAEVSWNHFAQHPAVYSIAQLESGRLSPASQAAGRMFCKYNRDGTEVIIWTQTDGNLLGQVIGSPHLQVWYWWLHVHHNIAFGGTPMGAMDADMTADPMPTG